MANHIGLPIFGALATTACGGDDLIAEAIKRTVSTNGNKIIAAMEKANFEGAPWTTWPDLPLNCHPVGIRASAGVEVLPESRPAGAGIFRG